MQELPRELHRIYGSMPQVRKELRHFDVVCVCVRVSLVFMCIISEVFAKLCLQPPAPPQNRTLSCHIDAQTKCGTKFVATGAPGVCAQAAPLPYNELPAANLMLEKFNVALSTFL